MKIKRFDISAEHIKCFLSGKRFDIQVTTNSLPKDAKLVRVYVDEKESTPDKISLYYISESFLEIPEGEYLKPSFISVTQYHKEENIITRCICGHYHCPICSNQMEVMDNGEYNLFFKDELLKLREENKKLKSALTEIFDYPDETASNYIAKKVLGEINNV